MFRRKIAFLFIMLALAGCATPERANQPVPVTESMEARAHAAMAADPPDWEAARAAFLAAAEAGSPTAMSHLGWIYEEGHGVPPDGAQAAGWYARAANAGALEYAVKLGWMYLIGESVPRDRALAEAWFKAAIDAGYSPARIAWASVLIADAQGGAPAGNVEEARVLLERALDDGYPTAAFFLARIYLEGPGGHPMDEERAAHFTRIGAEAGNAQMQSWLAFMHVQGRGVAQDYLAAAVWANLAAAGGDSFGEQLLQLLEAQLSPEETAAARQAAADWAARHE
jgi:uncharacterized protein